MKTIVYARVSTEKQDLDRQIKLAREYCQTNGHTIVDTIEEKISGTKGDRDGLNKLMSLTNEDCELVVVSELSRLTREEEFQRIFNRIDTLRDNGISIVFLDDPENVYSKDNPINFVQFIMLGVRAIGAREELTKIRSRMKSGRVSKLQVNPYMVTTSQIPFGFEKYHNPNYVQGKTPKSFIRINRDEATIVRKCYEMAITGSSCPQIADFLNNSGYIHRQNKGEKLWAPSEVGRMLKQRIYIGERTVEGITHQIEAIISREMFEQAAKCMKQNRCVVTKHEGRFNPLKGLLFCGDCGLPFTLSLWQDKLVYKCLYNSYKLKNPNKTYQICHNSRIHYDILLRLVWDSTVNRMKSSEYYGKSQLTISDYEAQLMSIQGSIATLVKQLPSITKEIRKRITQIDSLNDPDLIELVEEKLNVLKKQRETLRVKILNANKEFNKLQLKIFDLKSEIGWGDDNREMSIYEKAEFFNKVILKITFKGRKFKRDGVVTIFYKNGDTVTIETKTK